jgi:hypothetical protein
MGDGWMVAVLERTRLQPVSTMQKLSDQATQQAPMSAKFG